MSFDIYLIASSASPSAEDAQALARRALAKIGGHETDPPGVFVARDGADVEVYEHSEDSTAGGMFAVRGLPLSIAEIIFAVADAQKCFILPMSEGMNSYRTPGNDGDPPATEDKGFPPIIDIASPQELLDRISDGFDAWSNYRDQVITRPPPKPPSLLGRLFGGLFGKAN